ncbi:MAG TPA: zinc-binding dehydrogenase [Acidimicrobiia bacterium]|nr:zinc-binding dehydrogenase [Acidimicrobiia bacterium]
MRAIRLHAPGDLRLDEVPDPSPGESDVAVSVEAAGVCGSDLHFVDGTAKTSMLPITLGHEVAGSLASSSNARVVVALATACGVCDRCREQRPNLCDRVEVIGIHRDGGLADRIVVPVGSVIPIPDGVGAPQAATATDAGSTARHAVHRRAAVESGQQVAIIGIGGLGSYGVQMARNLGATVIAVDTSADALARATAFGAEAVVLAEPGMSVGRAVKELTDGGVDVAIEFVGAAATVDTAVKSLRPGGRAVAVGVGPEPLTTIPPVLWSNNEYTLTGSYGSLPGDTEAVLADLAAGRLVAPPVKIVEMEDAVGAITDAATRGSAERIVVTPQSERQ